MPEPERSLKHQSDGGKYEHSISLIIPCYNVPVEQISAALESVWKQTFSDYEVIVVDDGSDPEYAEVLTRLCGNGPNITLIRTENRGVSAARNTGIQAARGEYISFLDADDILADDFMERAWAAVSLTDADLVIGGTTLVDLLSDYNPGVRTEKLPYTLYSREEAQNLIPSLTSFELIIRFVDGYIGRGPWSRLVRVSVAKSMLFDEELKIGEDIVWNIQLLHSVSSVCLVRESWYGYWRNPGSATHRYSPEFIDRCEKQLKKIMELTDSNIDGIYYAVNDRIYENMRMIWKNVLLYECKTNAGFYHKAAQHIYTSHPWTEIGTWRSFRLSKGKKRLGIILYKMHFFYTAKHIKDLTRKYFGRHITRL